MISSYLPSAGLVGVRTVPSRLVGASTTGDAYAAKVLATGPIFYAPLWEPSGSTITDLVASRNGVTGGATPPTFGVAGIGDGRTALSFPGATAFGNIYSAGLAAVLNGALWAKGSAMIWGRPSAAGVWTDTTIRRLLHLGDGGGHILAVRRSAVNGQMVMARLAGGVNNTITIDGLASTGALSFILTWDQTANELKAYVNGAQVDTTKTPIGTWTGVLGADTNTIGAQGTAATQVWSGVAGHLGLWARALAPSEALAIGSPL